MQKVPQKLIPWASGTCLPKTQGFNVQEFGGRGAKDLAVKFLLLLGILYVPNSALFVCDYAFLTPKQINTELKEQLNNRFGGCKRLRTGSHAVPACTQTTAPCPRLETTISAATLGYRVTEANRGQPAFPPLWRYQQTPLPPRGKTFPKRMSGEQYFSIRGKHPAIVMLKGCLCYPFLVSCPLLALCTYRGWRFPDTGMN